MRMRMRGFLQSHRRGIASLNYADIEGETPTSGIRPHLRASCPAFASWGPAPDELMVSPSRVRHAVPQTSAKGRGVSSSATSTRS